MKVWLNGELVDREDAKISVFDHGLLYGDGVFEGVRIYGGRIFQAKAHVDRLFESASRIRLEIPYGKQQIIDAMYAACEANDVTDGYIRPVVTRGPGTLGLNPFKCSDPVVFVIADDISLYPREMYENGLAVIIARTIRTPARAADPAVKSLNYLNNIYAKIEAIDAGVMEAIMLNVDGYVAEATGDNIYIVEDGNVVTPPPQAGILMGITRAVVKRLCDGNGVEFIERNLKPEELYDAEECFLTGTAAEVIPVTKIDETTIGDGTPGPVTKKLLGAFHEFIRSGEEL
ncbi:MAG: branched-chain-amino-acid transaminase [Phycisphaerae bacterium]